MIPIIFPSLIKIPKNENLSNDKDECNKNSTRDYNYKIILNKGAVNVSCEITEEFMHNVKPEILAC